MNGMPILSVMKIGRSVKQRRVRAFMTQEQLARAAGISLRQLVRIEKNEVEPRFSTILKLGKALGVDPSELVDKE
jgi:transcriptional regulator with XRE-family HTH domain